jgi:hypothetical protein
MENKNCELAGTVDKKHAHVQQLFQLIAQVLLTALRRITSTLNTSTCQEKT